jgi:thioredoxin-like negative regulator of GroEL
MPVVTSITSGLGRQPVDLVPLIRASELAATVKQGAVVVELMNFGCPYCRNAMPELDRVAHEKQGKVRFAKMSLADPQAQALAGQLGVQMLPAFAVFHNGKLLGTFERQGGNQVDAQFIRDNVNAAFASVGVQV